MSFLVRPTVLVAIIFGCFAALIPRLIFPLFRSKPSSPSPHSYENFRRSPIPTASVDTLNNDDPTGVDIIEPIVIDPTESKSVFTFALPMYSVGIVVFFIYTCCKYFSRRNRQELKLRERYSTENIRWNADQRRFKYDTNNTPIAEELEDHEEEQYAGLDADYVAYLKARRQKEKDVQRATTAEQTKMGNTLDSMKNSLSFINTKLAANETRGNLSHNEISELKDRLAATEAQMYQILSAIDAASNRVQELTKKTSRQSLEDSSLNQVNEEDLERLSANDDGPMEDETSLSDTHSFSRDEEEDEDEDEDEDDEDDEDGDDEDEDEEAADDKGEESSSSSYEDDDMMKNEARKDRDDQSEASSERYGLMETNYDCDPIVVDDYELNLAQSADPANNSRTKVYEWRKRNDHSSMDQDQTLPENENADEPTS